MDRQKYINDYGMQIDPLFDMVDTLQAKLDRVESLCDELMVCDTMYRKVARKFQAAIKDK